MPSKLDTDKTISQLHGKISDLSLEVLALKKELEEYQFFFLDRHHKLEGALMSLQAIQGQHPKLITLPKP